MKLFICVVTIPYNAFATVSKNDVSFQRCKKEERNLVKPVRYNQIQFSVIGVYLLIEYLVKNLEFFNECCYFCTQLTVFYKNKCYNLFISNDYFAEDKTMIKKIH